MRTPRFWKVFMYGAWLRPPISGAKKRSGETSSTLRTGLGRKLGRLHSGMCAVVIVDQYVFGRLDVAGEDVPGGGDEILARLDASDVLGRPPVATRTMSGSRAWMSEASA